MKLKNSYDGFTLIELLIGIFFTTLAAVAMSANLLRLIGILGHGISTGTVILVAQSLGANKPEDGQRIAMQALILSLICGLGVGCLGYPSAESGLRLLGAEKDVQ